MQSAMGGGERRRRIGREELVWHVKEEEEEDLRQAPHGRIGMEEIGRAHV